jgi:hypothetical protein
MAKWARDMVVFFVAWMYALTFEKQANSHEPCMNPHTMFCVLFNFWSCVTFLFVLVVFVRAFVRSQVCRDWNEPKPKGLARDGKRAAASGRSVQLLPTQWTYYLLASSTSMQ